MTSNTYSFSQLGVNSAVGSFGCTGPVNISRSETAVVSETCLFRMLAVVYPAVPNAQVFDSYALSEAVSFKKISSPCTIIPLFLLVLPNLAIMLL